MKKINLTLLLLIILISTGHSQSYFSGKFKTTEYTHEGKSFTLYDFSRTGAVIRAKYFAQNAYTEYLKWKGTKEILLVTAGAFSDSWGVNGKPIGLCVDNGHIVSRVPDSKMDGMVIVYNGSSQIGGIAIVDLDKSGVKCKTSKGDYKYYYPRNSYTDRSNFLNWGEDNGLTLFQTQLVYSEKKSYSENFSNLYYGNSRERRFLAICKKSGTVHHVIIDIPDPMYLNLAAKQAKYVLEYDGFDVLYIMNLDTGGKNILHAYNGVDLKNLQPNYNSEARIEKATNLIIYYKD